MPELLERLTAALSDRYAVESEIGRGGMAVVYLATDLKQGRQVALKVFQPDVAAALGPERFRREVEIATRLEHPHVLSLYDSGEAEGLLYYVMPYVEEGSLRQRLDREGQLPIEDALRIAREMAEGLDYAHEQGVVHRDVKPGNVLLQRGHALLADFGVARALEEAGGDRLTKTGVSVGTPHYMAPEQATGAESADARSDVYAVGAVLYEMLAGEPPYTGSTPQAILARRLAGPPTPIPVLRETVGPDVDGIVQQAMARSPADRWQSAGNLAKALAAAERGGTPIPGLSTWPGVTGEITAVGEGAKRGRRWVLPVVGIVAAAGLILSGVWYSRQRETGEDTSALDLLELDPMLVLVVPERPSDLEGDAWTRLLSDRVKALGDLEVVPLADVMYDLRSFSILPTRIADSVAAARAAGKLVMVNATEIGEGLRLNVSLRATGDPSTVLAEIDTTVFALDHQSWAPAIVVRLFENQEKGLTSEANLAAMNTGSVEPEAEIWASRGAAYWGRGQYDSAMIAYQAAVNSDPSFVEAWGMLGDAASFSAPSELPFNHDSVRIHRDVAERAKERFEALGGVTDSAIPSLDEARRMAEVQSANPDAWWNLYEAMGRDYWKRGWEPDSVLEPLLKSVELAPHDSYKRFSLIVYYTYAGDPGRVREVLADASALDLSIPVAPLWPALVTLSLGTDEQKDSVLAALPRDSGLMNFVNFRLFLIQDDMGLIARFAAIAFAPGWATVWLVRYNLAGGEWNQGMRTIELDDNDRARFTHTVEARAGMAGTGVLRLPAQVVRESRDSALAASPGNALEVLQRLHRLGLMSAQLSDHGAAQAYADSLDEFAREARGASIEGSESDYSPAELAEMASDAALEVQALDAWLDGRPEHALNLLERQTFESFPGFPRDFMWVTARTYGRFLRAEILYDLGRFEEAAGWYATIPRISMGFHLEALLLAPVFSGRARALDALGRYDQAIHYYRRFVTRWQDADPHLQPQVEEARQRIRELEAELD